MSKKYEKKIKTLKNKKEDKRLTRKSPVIDGRIFKSQSMKKQKKFLKDLKKKMDRSNRIW
ncbi:hypothetical protein LCGC14_0928780 [marine sediment metagenome]|uniref:Uncharacterized protein n=1 Tax=marine sediment metagenome TaxID=412755 RepID=A0A0F9NNN2_9ZZZZ|nr:hypothetical protein [archaeon]